MAVSSLTVVLSSLGLKWYTKPSYFSKQNSLSNQCSKKHLQDVKFVDHETSMSEDAAADHAKEEDNLLVDKDLRELAVSDADETSVSASSGLPSFWSPIISSASTDSTSILSDAVCLTLAPSDSSISSVSTSSSASLPSSSLIRAIHCLNDDDIVPSTSQELDERLVQQEENRKIQEELEQRAEDIYHAKAQDEELEGLTSTV